MCNPLPNKEEQESREGRVCVKTSSGGLHPAHAGSRLYASTEVMPERANAAGGLLERSANDLRALLTTCREPRFGGAETVVLATFSLLLLWCIPHHESWFDEAQAWLIARSSTLPDLVVHRLHYEGSPALWHLLLWAEVRLGVSFADMHVIAGCIAAAGMFVWLRFNPLPRVLSLLAPFSFFLQYQYAVVARNYVLAPLFAYLLLALYQNRKSSPVLFCLIAGLFANCSLHMAAFSAGLCVMYAHDRWRGEGADRTRSSAQWMGAAALLLALFAAAAATAMPTADGSSTTANPVVGALRKSVPHTSTVQQVENPNEITAAPGQQAQPPAQGPIAQAVWRTMNQAPAVGTPAPHRIIDGRLVKHLLVLLTGTTASISTSNLLALGFLLVLTLNLRQTHLWITLVPWGLIQICNVLIAGEAHHFGLLWIALTCAVWVISSKPIPRGRAARLRTGLYGYLLIVLVLQIGWSVHAMRSDVAQPYSSSRATAEFVKSLPKGERIAAFDDDSVTVNAYLPKSPYFNQPLDYWPFSRTRDPSLLLERVMAERPDVVSLKMAAPEEPVMHQWVKMNSPGTVFVAQAQLKLLTAEGYRETHRFCGHRFFRDSSESTDCRLIYEPRVPAASARNP